MKDPYKKTARFYDAAVEPFNGALRKILLKMHSPKAGMRVLEIGCGTGTNLQLYQEAGCNVFGIDLSPSMVTLAKEKLGEQSIRLGDASDMPYPDGYFDLVIAMLTLHEMPGDKRSPVITEIKRVMKQDGRLMLVDYHPGPIRFPKGVLAKIIILFFERIAGREHFMNFKNFLNAKCLPPLIKRHHLSIGKRKILSGGNLAIFSAAKAEKGK